MEFSIEINKNTEITQELVEEITKKIHVLSKEEKIKTIRSLNLSLKQLHIFYMIHFNSKESHLRGNKEQIIYSLCDSLNFLRLYEMMSERNK